MLKVVSSDQTLKSGKDSHLTCKNRLQSSTEQSWVVLDIGPEQSWFLQFPLLMPQNISNAGFRDTDRTRPFLCVFL
jgi:hypothetical protein